MCPPSPNSRSQATLRTPAEPLMKLQLPQRATTQTSLVALIAQQLREAGLNKSKSTAGDNKMHWTQRITFFGELLTRQTKAANK